VTDITLIFVIVGMMLVCTTITLHRVIHEIKRLDSEVMLLRHKLQDLEAKSPTEERWFDV
jgi:hypothetical protein